MKNQSQRVEYLDSIRGLAALFVLFSHTIGALQWPDSISILPNIPFVKILFDGKAAVAMFFVLSGYVLSKPYVQKFPTAPSRKLFLPTFYLRRFTRIWPPWFFVFCLSILCRRYCFHTTVSLPPTSDWLHGFWQTSMTDSDFLRQCLFQLHDTSRQLLNQDWSLGVELKGSLLIPLFLLLVRGKRLLGFTLLAGFFFAFVHTGHYYLSFMLGVLVAHHRNLLMTGLQMENKFYCGLVLLGGLLLYQGYSTGVHYFGDSDLVVKIGWIGTAIGCALILLSALNSRRIQAFLNHKPFVFLGRISYSIYLLQFIIILCVLPPAVVLFNNYGITNPFLIFPLTMLLSSGLTISCSALTYRFIEIPSINLGHTLSTAIQSRWIKKST